MSSLQFKIYQFIKEFLSNHGYSPSLLEITAGVGISPRSKGLVSRYVHKLVKSGRLAFDGKGYRNIVLPLVEKLCLSVEGKITADSEVMFMIEPQDAIVNLTSLFGEDEIFVLVAKGDVLAIKGILSGDKIICKRQSSAKDGSLVVVLIDDQHAMLKYIRYSDHETIELNSHDNKLTPILYAKKRVAIKGIVIGIFRIVDCLVSIK